MSYRKRTLTASIVVTVVLIAGAYFVLNSPPRLQLDASEAVRKSVQSSDTPLAGKSILFVVAPRNFRDEELLETKRMLKNSGAKCTIASTIGDSISGMLGAKVMPDMLLSDARAKDYDAIIFVGGSGAMALWNNSDAHRVAKAALKANKLVAAICLAPVILANSGVLKNCDATVFPSAKKQLSRKGAKYVDRDVVVCGNIITANGPKAVKKFAKAIKSALIKQNNK